MPRKMARQTLERHAGACYSGSRPYLGSGLLGSPENRYNLPHFRVHPGNPGSRPGHAGMEGMTSMTLAIEGKKDTEIAARSGRADLPLSGLFRAGAEEAQSCHCNTAWAESL